VNSLYVCTHCLHCFVNILYSHSWCLIAYTYSDFYCSKLLFNICMFVCLILHNRVLFSLISLRHVPPWNWPRGIVVVARESENYILSILQPHRKCVLYIGNKLREDQNAHDSSHGQTSSRDRICQPSDKPG